MKKPKTIALIGVGGHGGRHLSIIDKLESEGVLRLICVADPFPEKQVELKSSLNSRGIRWYSDYREMLASEDGLELAVVSAPIPLHEEMTLELLNKTSARILLEKPAVPTIQQLDGLIFADPSKRIRVAYQTIFRPQVRQLKDWILGCHFGELESVTVLAGWPRSDSYYRRASWAGKMVCNDRPVFDGPATNGLSHLLNNVAFLLGRDARAFASPNRVRASLSRGRKMESYDTAQIESRMEGQTVNVLLTHAVSEPVPFQVIVRGAKGTASLLENRPWLSNSMGLGWTADRIVDDDKESMYREFCSDDGVFDEMVGTLADVRSYTLWTNAALLSSGGIHDIPQQAVRCISDGAIDVPQLAIALKAFGATPAPLEQLGCAWAPLGRWIEAAEVNFIALV